MYREKHCHKKVEFMEGWQKRNSKERNSYQSSKKKKKMKAGNRERMKMNSLKSFSDRNWDACQTQKRERVETEGEKHLFCRRCLDVCRPWWRHKKYNDKKREETIYDTLFSLQECDSYTRSQRGDSKKWYKVYSFPSKGSCITSSLLSHFILFFFSFLFIPVITVLCWLKEMMSTTKQYNSHSCLFRDEVIPVMMIIDYKKKEAVTFTLNKDH